MKTLKSKIAAAALLFAAFTVSAQNKSKLTKDQQRLQIKQAVENKTFEFIPEYGRADGGKDVSIESVGNYYYRELNLYIKNGAIASFMPSAISAGLGLYRKTSAVYEQQFGSQKNSWQVSEKKGTYTIVIKVQDDPEVSQINLTVTPDGKYSSARVLNYHHKATNYIGAVTPIIEAEVQTGD